MLKLLSLIIIRTGSVLQQHILTVVQRHELVLVCLA